MKTEVFEQNRSRLTGIAYGMLGSVMEAEDVVQDTYLRWMGVDSNAVDSPAAFLTTTATRLAIDRLRSARRRRETYLGPWLPEPVIGPVERDPADVVAEAESLSLAMLTALERLQPVERAVLLLREIFDFDYSEIADIVERSPDNCRQIARRARERAGDLDRSRPTTEAEQFIINRYTEAVTEGDVERLAAIFAEDVVLWSDGGGKARAARHPIYGAPRVARHLIGVAPQTPSGTKIEVVRTNGEISLMGVLNGTVIGIVAFEISDDQVIGVRAVLNPDKLAAVPRQTDLAEPAPPSTHGSSDDTPGPASLSTVSV
jgi:RNA polymerase sigma-70 factor (ECF subfamily)